MGILNIVKVEILKLILSIVYWLSSLIEPYDRHAVLLLSSRTASMSIGMSMLLDELSEDSDVTVKMLFYSRTETKFVLLQNAIRAVRQIARAGVIIVDDHCFPLNALYKKRKRNITIQIWHAVGGFKKFGNAKITDTRVPHKNYDYVCVNSAEDITIYAEALGVKKDQVRVTGSLQIQYIEELTKRIPSVTGDTEQKKVFFAPTYRTGGNEDLSATMMEELINYLENSVFNYELSISLHPYIDEEKIPVTYRVDRNFFYETLLSSDLLITDYSSLVIDYSIMKKPVVLWTPDLENYTNRNGFYEKYGITDGLTKIRNLDQLFELFSTEQGLTNLKMQEEQALLRLSDRFFTGTDALINICRVVKSAMNE